MLGADRVIVALDCSADRARTLVSELGDNLKWVKVGMELFYAAGAPLVRELKERGLSVFLDLKLHDIPNTVASATRVLAGLGVDMLTVHASGGPKMVEAARAGLDEGAALAGLPAPKLLAVSVLTSMDEAELSKVGVERPVAEQADLLARMARQAGADGMICSAFEARAMSVVFGAGGLVVTPGIRPAGSATQDQSRVATPAFAIGEGATHLVIGRPVTRADDPAAALLAIEDEASRVLA